MTEADIIQKLLRKSMYWFLYDIDLRHERVKPTLLMKMPDALALDQKTKFSVFQFFI